MPRLKKEKPIASLSLDLDDKWTYMKTHGDAGWETFPSYLDLVVPRILQFLRERDLTITFFIVGQDAALARNHALLRSIADAGHEIANHSFSHEPWLHLFSDHEIEREFDKAEESIERATGQKPVGFRGPGYSLSNATLEELVKRNYLYDASTFPTFVLPLARLYYFSTADFSKKERQTRRHLGGTFKDGFRPNAPYKWSINGDTLIELPVTTLPFLKLPVHLTYIFSLLSFSRRIATTYFQMALKCCHSAGVEPSILLHPTDFLGCNDISTLAFLPGMGMTWESKLEFVDHVLQMLMVRHEVVTLSQHAHSVNKTPRLKHIGPNFARA